MSSTQPPSKWHHLNQLANHAHRPGGKTASSCTHTRNAFRTIHIFDLEVGGFGEAKLELFRFQVYAGFSLELVFSKIRLLLPICFAELNLEIN